MPSGLTEPVRKPPTPPPSSSHVLFVGIKNYQLPIVPVGHRLLTGI